MRERVYAVVSANRGWIVLDTIRRRREDAEQFLRQAPFNEHGYHVEPVSVALIWSDATAERMTGVSPR